MQPPPPALFPDQAPPTRHPELGLLVALLALFAGAAAAAPVLRSCWRRRAQAIDAAQFHWTPRRVFLLALALLNLWVTAVIPPEQAALALVNGTMATVLLFALLVHAVSTR
jgi:hypothetical protein